MKTYAGHLLKFAVASLAMAFVAACTIARAEPAELPEANPDQSAIYSVLSDVAQDWNTGAYENLKSHWDLTDTQPIYLAEEADQIMTSWPQVEAYWNASEKWIEWIVVDYSNYHLKRVDETNAMVTFDLRFDLKLNDRARPIGGDNRVVVSLRKVDGVWKIYAWVEAPLSAITYVRKLYELNVREDLPNR